MADTQLANKGKSKVGFTAYLTNDAVKRQVNSVVGGKNGTRFISSIISAVQANTQLQECTNTSILNAALLGEALNLSLSQQLGQCYMVPFNNKKKGIKEAQFQLGYKGYIQLAVRSGYYKKLNVLEIKEGELIRFDPLNEDIEVKIISDDVIREQAETTGYYGMFEYENGFRKVLYWSKQKMEAHADQYSQAFKLSDYRLLKEGKIPGKDLWKYSSFWYKDFDAMATKTMLRQLISKWGIMSIDMQSAMERDMAVIGDNDAYDYVDNQPVSVEQEVREDIEENANTEDFKEVVEEPAHEEKGEVTPNPGF